MKRRSFLQAMAAAGLCAATPLTSQRAVAAPPYDGPFFLTIQAEGGWDVTSLCDPKANGSINQWANGRSQVRRVGSTDIHCPVPYALNGEFFDRHASNMLVINGIDSQTNAHIAGVRHNWSGRFIDGFPAFTALIAAARGADLPLAFISNGGYRETAGLVPFTMMNSQNVSTLTDPNLSNANGASRFHRSEQLDIIARHRAARAERLNNTDIMPRMSRALNGTQSSIASIGDLTRLDDVMPSGGQLVSEQDADGQYNPLLRQAQLSIAAFTSGLTVSADLMLGGFDTHDDHDNTHEPAIRRLQRGIDYVWQEAEARGIADRLRVFITSDFGRTPRYNDGNGKDHWPINSAILMQERPSWGGRVIGGTDAEHNALGLNASTYETMDSGGVIIQPKHVQQLLRRMSGIENDPLVTQFNLNADELDLFGAVNARWA